MLVKNDCVLDLLTGVSLSTLKLYGLYEPEEEAVEGHIKDSLAVDLICPSPSPGGATFFFVEKKDKSLHPCIDYQGLNEITVKNKYPLPLIDSAFGPLHVIFTKLDLYLVCVKEAMNGRQLSTLICSILNICPLASPTPQLSSKPS